MVVVSVVSAEGREKAPVCMGLFEVGSNGGQGEAYASWERGFLRVVR